MNETNRRTRLDETLPRGLRYNPKQLGRLVALAKHEGSHVTHGALQFLSAALWCIARSPSGREGLLEHAPHCIPHTIEMAFTMRPIVAAVAKRHEFPMDTTPEEEALIAASVNDCFMEVSPYDEDLPCVKGLEFAISTLWLMSYSETDSVLGHGDVYEVKSGAVWTVPRVSTPTAGPRVQSLSFIRSTRETRI